MPKYTDPPGFAEWETTIPATLRRDPIWRTPAYRYGLWLADLVREDVKQLFPYPEWKNNAGQMVRACEGISSNISEGYGCLSGPERVRYYGYALTSARESIDWYVKARAELGMELVEERLILLDRIIRILTSIIPRERKRRRTPPPPPPDDEERA
jgi:four helix bundle protein